MREYISEGVSLYLDREKCVGCGLCHMICPHRIFKVEFSKANIKEKNKCIECGACMNNCPVGAIKVNAGTGCAIAILGTSGTC